MIRLSSVLCLIALVASPCAAAELPAGVTAKSFENPPNEFRLVQYQLTRGALNDYPKWGIGGYMGFFYKNLYQQGPKGVKQIGPWVDAAHESGNPVWLADDWGYPSGMAGGRVVAENTEFEVRSLVMLSHKGSCKKPINWTLPKDLHDILCVMLYPAKGGGIDLKAGKRVKPQGKKVTATQLGAARLRSLHPKHECSGAVDHEAVRSHWSLSGPDEPRSHEPLHRQHARAYSFQHPQPPWQGGGLLLQRAQPHADGLGRKCSLCHSPLECRVAGLVHQDARL